MFNPNPKHCFVMIGGFGVLRGVRKNKFRIPRSKSCEHELLAFGCECD